MPTSLHGNVNGLPLTPQKFEGSILWMLILRICWHILCLIVRVVHVVFHLTEVMACYFSSSGVFMKRHRVLLPSKPRYLAIVVDSEEAKLISHIGTLVTWVADIGIKYVILYDMEGVLKGYEAILKKLVKCDSNLSRGSRADKMSIELLSMSDGRQGIAKAANLLYSNYLKNGNLRGEKTELLLTEADMSNALIEVGCGAPEPDLLLVFGPARCHLGFPPWRMRYTEIVHMGPLHSVSYHAIIKALNDFSRKHQNYGS